VRKFLIGAVVLATALITAAVALGVTQRTFNEKFTNKATATPVVTKTGSATGALFSEHSEDPANTDNNKQPISDDVDTDIFPKGAAIVQKAIPQCNATEQDFSQKGDQACPSKSNVGSGSAKVRTKFNGTNDIPATVKLYNATKHRLFAYVSPTPGQPIVIPTVVKGKPGKTQKLIITVPITCVLGTPPNCGSAGEARIVDLSLFIHKVIGKVKSHGKKVKTPFLKTPKTCPKSGHWTFTFLFHHRDNSGTDKSTSTSACKAPKKH
jgi:hypothetical protein